MFLRVLLLSVILILPHSVFAQYNLCKINDRDSEIKATLTLDDRSFVVDFSDFSVGARCDDDRMYDFLLTINSEDFSIGNSGNVDDVKKYLDVENHGTITFKSTDVPIVEGDDLVIIGVFSIRNEEIEGQIKLAMPKSNKQKNGFTQICFRGSGATELQLKSDDNTTATLEFDKLKICLLVPND